MPCCEKKYSGEKSETTLIVLILIKGPIVSQLALMCWTRLEFTHDMNNVEFIKISFGIAKMICVSDFAFCFGHFFLGAAGKVFSLVDSGDRTFRGLILNYYRFPAVLQSVRDVSGNRESKQMQQRPHS